MGSQRLVLGADGCPELGEAGPMMEGQYSQRLGHEGLCWVRAAPGQRRAPKHNRATSNAGSCASTREHAELAQAHRRGNHQLPQHAQRPSSAPRPPSTTSSPASTTLLAALACPDATLECSAPFPWKVAKGLQRCGYATLLGRRPWLPSACPRKQAQAMGDVRVHHGVHDRAGQAMGGIGVRHGVQDCAGRRVGAQGPPTWRSASREPCSAPELDTSKGSLCACATPSSSCILFSSGSTWFLRRGCVSMHSPPCAHADWLGRRGASPAPYTDPFPHPHPLHS